MYCTENFDRRTTIRRRLADLVVAERQWVATMVILVWVKLMDPLQAVFQDFFLLVKMIALMIGAKFCSYVGRTVCAMNVGRHENAADTLLLPSRIIPVTPQIFSSCLD